MDSWLACHDFEHMASEDLPSKGGRCTLNLLRFEHPIFGEEVRRGGARSECRPLHFTTVQNYKGSALKPGRRLDENSLKQVRKRNALLEVGGGSIKNSSEKVRQECSYSSAEAEIASSIFL
ncbi:hypothetical protein TNCV_914861 [Trichonephila clavipes]|uniref:Uncharacterized protein n=1 Tax=Trichonephila clavipes TaxID=2585209 RepID=A0A8X6RD28_TRICX|nr:hypothetical protein TNCV_914861 [Trichonephila clavipes]